jgi:hypothetical protein
MSDDRIGRYSVSDGDMMRMRMRMIDSNTNAADDENDEDNLCSLCR